MTKQTKNNSLFWLGFLVALILVVGLVVFYYKHNKNKKLSDIKKQLEDFINHKLKCYQVKKKLPAKTKTSPKKPKKFIVKK